MTNIISRKPGRQALLFFSVILPVVFLAITYFSCKKDNCTYVHCLNSGTCNNGICTCAAGYNGDSCQNLATSYITYTNNTFTPVVITVNGYTQTIPSGGMVTYSGYYSDSAVGIATTVGAGASGGTLGETVTWTIANAFAVSTQNMAIDVSASYYFLKIANNGTASVNKILVNQLVATETVNATFPGTGATYGVGYFYAYSNSTLEAIYANGNTFSDTTLALPMTANQSFTFTTH